MRIFLSLAFCLTTWAQDTPTEYKLPENFLRFDINKLRPAVSTPPKSQSKIVLPPEQVSCGHIRVLPVNPDLDPGMILPLPTYVYSRMPVFKGMPACQTAGR